MSKNWKNVMLLVNSSVRDALSVMNEEALRICLVVDQQTRLLGVVTDGDIRRAILNNVGLDEAIVKIMITNPLSVVGQRPRSELLKLMQEKSILSLPVLDEQGRVIGLETWDKLSQKAHYDNPVFIMAGGFGTRLKPLTDTCPKPMLKVGDKPILETLLNQFVKEGFRNIYISTHYMPEQITDYFGDGSAWGASIRYVHEDTPLGTGGALGLLPDDLPELPIIMINGDVLTTVNFQHLLNFHMDNSADVTMCVCEYDYQIPYGVINGDGNKIISMIEKPVHHFFVNAGIYVVSPSIVKSVVKGQRIDMPTLINNHMQDSKQVLMFPIYEYWLDIGRIEDFNKAQSEIISLELH
ncbi:CBS domain-containing protein [Plesiomonas shigelloides]|uniref:nucleotidyltransferase family protein n=1 Tax=Plesiomonas shigelloides TaxID=703 RepID=UPI001261F323|nr:nucleotidyltransferase family protein [Plesiomonas shigelloides]KAB7701671.1 CBS domain-containing protein [Plesiomonas shigelloides]